MAIVLTRKWTQWRSGATSPSSARGVSWHRFMNTLEDLDFFPKAWPGCKGCNVHLASMRLEDTRAHDRTAPRDARMRRRR